MLHGLGTTEVLFYNLDVFLNDGSTLVCETTGQELLSSENFVASEELSILLEHGSILIKMVLSELVLEVGHCVLELLGF